MIFNNTTLNLLSSLITIITTFFIYIKWKQTYWKRRGIPYIQPHYFYGNFKELFLKQTSFGEHYLNMYKIFKKRRAQIAGGYSLFTPFLIPIDPTVIRYILIKDFQNFCNRGFFINEKDDPLTGSLLNLENERWKQLRTKLTPTFSSGKIKNMFGTIMKCTEDLTETLQGFKNNSTNIKEILDSFTIDVISSCAFGIESNSLKNPNCDFRKFTKILFERRNLKEKLTPILIRILPRKLLCLLRFKQTKKDVEDFFMGVIKDNVDYRRKFGIDRQDFLQLLIELNELTLNEISAQSYVFFLAGYETSSTTLMFALFELAKNPEIQQNLRKEIKNFDNITYENITEMKYLERIILETLRKYPPFPAIPRICNKSYKIPESSIIIEEGTTILIPIWGVHMDPEFYTNPEIFDPERFSKENESQRPPCTFLSFGEGPRNCIGLRFGMLQTKIGLISIIKNFEVTVSEEMKLPIKYNNKSFITSVKGGVWLNFTSIFQIK